MSFFSQLPVFLPDSILGLQQQFLEDERPGKINLIIGAYEDPAKAYGGLSVVGQAQELFLKGEENKRYLPIRGLPSFLEGMKSLLFGDVESQCVVGCQALGGSGALHLGGVVFSLAYPSGVVSIPQQSWGNHERIFAQQGLEVVRYPYYNKENKKIDFEGMVTSIQELPNRSLVVLQCCCHNPTGTDLDLEMWSRLAEVMKEKELIPFFDTAYLGFGDGIEEDRRPIDLFVKAGMVVFVAACASKGFSLYGERVGYFAAYDQDGEDLVKITSCLEEKIRGEYSSPPRHGALIVSTILSDPRLKQEWVKQLSEIRMGLNGIRTKFVHALRHHVGHSLDFILSQKGFFGYPGFSSEQVEFLRAEKAIYTTGGARLNLKGITDENLEYVVECFSEAYQI